MVAIDPALAQYDREEMPVRISGARNRQPGRVAFLSLWHGAGSGIAVDLITLRPGLKVRM